ncbi:MAG: bis(5'-nucleosyl)-tetraphosphatase (symmetrical) YqeK [Coriobacteriia bacterium]|nr:bis(5'-nucleosyl)-tetraphosphatase (symmetrical) YqeK [Coriobacteriia bacterium]
MPVTYELAREAVVARLSADGAAHCERVAEMAAGIASVYGVDPAAARLAGVLHDWHRETDVGELLRQAEASDVAVTEVDRAVPYLLHGPVAAHDLAREYPGIGGDVLEAVAAHTCGAPVMSALAMTVYISDIIEPRRRYARASELRGVVGDVTLGELFARAYSASLGHLIETRRMLHPVTLEVYNLHVAGVRP